MRKVALSWLKSEQIAFCRIAAVPLILFFFFLFCWISHLIQDCPHSKLLTVSRARGRAGIKNYCYYWNFIFGNMTSANDLSLSLHLPLFTPFAHCSVRREHYECDVRACRDVKQSPTQICKFVTSSDFHPDILKIYGMKKLYNGKNENEKKIKLNIPRRTWQYDGGLLLGIFIRSPHLNCEPARSFNSIVMTLEKIVRNFVVVYRNHFPGIGLCDWGKSSPNTHCGRSHLVFSLISPSNSICFFITSPCLRLSKLFIVEAFYITNEEF